jgi:hypothetical protein
VEALHSVLARPSNDTGPDSCDTSQELRCPMRGHWTLIAVEPTGERACLRTMRPLSVSEGSTRIGGQAHDESAVNALPSMRLTLTMDTLLSVH